MAENFSAILTDTEKRVEEVLGGLLVALRQKPVRKGMRLARVLEQLGCANADALLRAAISTGTTATMELLFEQQARWLLLTVEPRAKEGSILGARVTLQEITAQKKNEAFKNLSTQMTSLSLLARHISHRLNNPLAAILNRIGCLLLEDIKASDWQRLRRELTGIQDQVYALSLITNALDVFARDVRSAGKLVQVNRVLEKAIDLARLLNVDNQVKYRLNLQPDLPPVFGNDILLEQCFLHILRNAQEAISDGGTIHVHSQIKPKNDAFIQVVIRDTGSGIPAQYLQQVFEPFFTLKGEDHLGLGLCIGYSIIDSLKGYIELVSDGKAGTTVTISLPIVNSIINRG
ncbi:hypothetical protein JXO59_01090 [candidate division KSB1 bacterium]|nr:hypothetical protein [candidate division KSB1 bacterium]